MASSESLGLSLFLAAVAHYTQSDPSRQDKKYCACADGLREGVGWGLFFVDSLQIVDERRRWQHQLTIR